MSGSDLWCMRLAVLPPHNGHALGMGHAVVWAQWEFVEPVGWCSTPWCVSDVVNTNGGVLLPDEWWGKV